MTRTSKTEMTPRQTTHDFFALGEVVVDFISEHVASTLVAANTYKRHMGGQAANLTMNMSRFGCSSAIAACIGTDGLGMFATEQLSRAGVDLRFLQTSSRAPTTIASITRQTQTPEFIIFRGADSLLEPAKGLLDAVRQSHIVHTSAFALSRDPARDTILTALQAASDAGATVSFDPNYHTDIWPDHPDMIGFLQNLYPLVDITKPSLEDCQRLLGAGQSIPAYAQQFLEWGAHIVFITMGEEGVYVATTRGEPFHMHATPNLNVVDVTGAGDAFWAGTLAAYVRGFPLDQAVRMGQAFAEFKIRRVGPVTDVPTWDQLEGLASHIQITHEHEKGG